MKVVETSKKRKIFFCFIFSLSFFFVHLNDDSKRSRNQRHCVNISNSFRIHIVLEFWLNCIISRRGRWKIVMKCSTACESSDESESECEKLSLSSLIMSWMASFENSSLLVRTSTNNNTIFAHIFLVAWTQILFESVI